MAEVVTTAAEPPPIGQDTEKTSDSPPPSPPPPPRRARDRDRDYERPPRRGGGDYYDRNRSPPPPPPRGYNKRGRRSLSPPPPPPFRDRRGGQRSPPGRRSPPPYKRRRDEGYDRRFGYDYPGGYERDMGGRPGYHNERPYGRHMGRSSGGYQEWDSGRAAGALGPVGSQREGMMSYKQFIQELEDDILPSEAERRYQEYRTEYISTQKRSYFAAHKDEEWLKDKYHPTNLLAVIEKRNELARKLAKDFQLDLQSGTLDLGPKFNASSSSGVEQSSERTSDDEGDAGKRRGPGRDNDLSSAPKAHPVSSETRRTQVDIELALALVRKLDSEKGIEENVLCHADNERSSRDHSHGSSSGPVVIIRGLNAVKGLEGVELLDTLLTYLWRIHGVDYYGLVETNEAKGMRHVRGNGKNSSATVDGHEWEKKINSHWEERLKGSDPLEVMTAKDKIDAAATEALDPYVRKIRDEKYGWKYGCGAKGCTKLFHAAEFVHKHLKLKHSELSVELTSKVQEELYFQNYMKDESAPGGKPVMQPSVKERLQWHRPGPDNRMRDDRGNPRERDNRGNGNESGDYGPNNDGAHGTNMDDPMFDSFGGPGIAVAPFSSEIPPPVLMPLPGAGPLGPFVPAPPEVAMRMFHEQGGGPPPFEGGRNARPGLQLGGPNPIILPPFQPDSRRLRRYDDLDAPDDEVTVIDYRSL